MLEFSLAKMKARLLKNLFVKTEGLIFLKVAEKAMILSIKLVNSRLNSPYKSQPIGLNLYIAIF
jgi:hypothetical protein